MSRRPVYMYGDLVLGRVGHPRVEVLHDLGLPAVDELPEAVRRVPLPLVVVLQHARRPLLLEHPAAEAAVGRLIYF